ncbi:hypothetical protein ACIA7S_28815 [Streptomyces sp. NPDC051643]|uniref:hypothetical protein n=1 Tax=Streptomyces sp. NPDC051643 TaxID=3365665 RepID=UPI00378B1A03
MSTEAAAAPVNAPAPPAETPTSAAAEEHPTATTDWTKPAAADKPRRRERGMPVGPVATAAVNAVALAGTGAYEVGGVPALAATGAVVVGGTVAAVARRRSTVKKRRTSPRANSLRGGSGTRRSGLGSSGLGGGSRGGSRGGSGASGGGGRRGAGTGGATSGWKTNSGGATRRTGSLLGSRHGGATGSRGKGINGTGGGTRGARHTLGAARHRANRNRPAAVRAAIAAARGAGQVARGTGRVLRRAAGAIGRSLNASWQAVRPQRSTTRATTRGALRKRGAAVWDGIRSLVSATGSRIWNPKNRDSRSWWTRVRDAWARRREARAAKAAARAAKVAATPDPNHPLAATVRRPAAASVPATFTGGALMPGHHFTGPAMEMARAAAAYSPQGMLQVGQDFAGLTDALEMVAEAMKISVDNADAKQPLHPSIVDHMKEIWQLQMRAAELAAELPVAFKRLHQVDIQRLENPRKGPEGEAMWDVRANLA